jgi:heptosyltransferase-2
LKSFFKFIVLNLLRLVDTPKKLRRIGEPLFWLAGFRKPAGPERTPANVAVIKLDRLGDVVLCSHFLSGLRHAWPKTRITLFVRESLVDLVRLCPDVDEVIGAPVDKGSMMFDPQTGEYRGWKQQLAHWLLFCWQRKLWAKHFDVVLVPRWESDRYGAVPLAYLTGAAGRWGTGELASETKSVDNREFDLLLTNIVPGKIDGHDFLLNNRFLYALGLQVPERPVLVSWSDGNSRKTAQDLMSAMDVTADKPLIVLCMGAGGPARMWPVERYAALCRRVFNLESIQLVAFGTAEEAQLGLQLKEMLGDVVINAEGKVPLKLLPAAVSLGSLYIGSDTGTKHLAAAAGLPVLEISVHPLNGDRLWSESPVRFGAWGVPSRIVQPQTATAPCREHCASGQPHCILGVSVEEAVMALHSLLDEMELSALCADCKPMDEPCQKFPSVIPS